MAFKTDQIKLKEDYANDGDAGTPVDGTLALIGATGSKQLKIRDDGDWVAISGGGGGGGASQLSDLSDVPSAPSTLNAVGVIDASNNLTFSKITVANIDSAAIDTGTDWTNNNDTIATTAAVQNYVSSNYLTSETSHADVLVDGDFGSAGLMTTDGAGNYSITATNTYLTSETSHADVVVDGDFGSEGIMRRGNADGVYSVITDNSTNWDAAYTWTQNPSNYSTVDDLNDLSDVATPASLDATHEGKVVGVVENSSGTASSITFDFSGVGDGTGIGGNIYFEIGGQDYKIFFDGGGNPVTSDTTFTLVGPDYEATIDGVQTTTNQVAQDVRVLLDNTFGSSGYTLSGTNPQVVMTADTAGTASNIDYLEGMSNINTAGFTMAEVAGTDPAYQYELINTSGAADPNWNHVQNTGWGENKNLSAPADSTTVTWVNTVDASGNKLIVYNPASYGNYCIITIMNASYDSMDFIRDSAANPAMQFNCMQHNPPLSNEITLDAFQKAILVKTTGNNWDVVIASI